MTKKAPRTGHCPYCSKDVELTKKGYPVPHLSGSQPCRFAVRLGDPLTPQPRPIKGTFQRNARRPVKP